MYDEQRVIVRDRKTIHQIRLGEEWLDLAIIDGDTRPPFRYGRPWQDHVPTHNRHLIGETP